jgi:N-carbamoylputrescine amidase
MKREIKVGIIQMKTMPGSSKEEKLNHSLKLIEAASQEDCKMILLGELCTTDYTNFFRFDPATYELAEPIPGPTTNAVGQLTLKYQNYVIMPIFEKKMAGAFYNAAPVIDPRGKVIGNYRKTHLASARVLERLYLRSGNSFHVWQTSFFPNVKFGTIICFDRRHPEPSRILATMGAEIMFCPTAVMEYAGGENQWDLVNRVRCIDTGMFGVYSNRVGKEGEYFYPGGSMIVDPHGNIIAHAGDEEDVIISAVLDLNEVDQARNTIPLMRELRNDLYARYYNHLSYDDLL